jgi:Protein kinase domain
MPLAAGIWLGPYEIQTAIGAGGMGEVYRAHDSRLGRDVAIKVLPQEVADDGEALARFEREARAVAALNHPNILALHDVGRERPRSARDARPADRDKEIAYAVTELLEGETLRHRLSAGPMAPRRALELGIQIARGLGAAHERGIVHRDLKPENLFVTRDGIKILDFGLAVVDPSRSGAWDQETTHITTVSGVLMGSPGYMSPEQALGQPATIRSDIFSFGVVVHEMLAGANPFKRATPHESIAAILREKPPPLPRDIPGIARLVTRCLEKQPADRPDSIRDIAAYLEALGSVTDVEATTVGAGVAETTLKRLRTRIALISCGLLLLLSAATWGYVRVMSDRVVTSAIDAELARAEGIVRRVHTARLGQLAGTARLVASFPELKALFETKDAATIGDFLQGYQQRNPGTPMLVALDPAGNVLARTDTAGAIQRTRDDWLAGMVASDGEPAVVSVGSRRYHAAGASADAGNQTFGYVLAAAPVDADFARSLRDATRDEVVLLSRDGVLASTLRETDTPWQSLDAWRADGGSDGRSTSVSVGAQRYAAREVPLVTDPPLAAVILKSRDEAIEPYRRIQTGLVIIGLAAMIAVILGSYWLTRSVANALRTKA